MNMNIKILGLKLYKINIITYVPIQDDVEICKQFTDQMGNARLVGPA